MEKLVKSQPHLARQINLAVCLAASTYALQLIPVQDDATYLQDKSSRRHGWPIDVAFLRHGP